VPISIQLTDGCRYCAFILNHTDHIGDVGDFSGVVHVKRKRQMPAAESVDVTREYLRLDLAIVEEGSGLGENLSSGRAADAYFRMVFTPLASPKSIRLKLAPRLWLTFKISFEYCA
jgi:hypothetical protein